ncbi:MAG: tRNA (guanosine(37)-N1)-methyltransferase TrmD [Chlamydiia bacterium]|nr:tRNA (guanosine(37)-N1)-methyltransferase TrmD [Chlamydiia bacterium]
MDIDILSLFPEYFESPLSVSMLKRAREKGLVNIACVNIRDFATDKHKTVDDRPYGGGPGMLLKAEPVVKAIRSRRREGTHVVYLSPQGKALNANKCQELAKCKHLVLLCGHYEGVDERAIIAEVDEEISIGDYVLTSGMPAANVVIDATVRFIPGVLGHEESARCDTFGEVGFDSPHYTRPEEFEAVKVPEVLLGGNHAQIEAWRKEQGLNKMSQVRPDLLAKEKQR